MPRWIIAFCLLSVFCGCSAYHAAPTTAPLIGTRQTNSASQPQADPKADLALDEIEPAPRLSVISPASDPSQPSIEAIELYARARDALASGHRFTAISTLEKAIALDPKSAELQRLIARAYLAGGNSGKAIDALRRACELDPDDGRGQTALGRLNLLQNDPTAAMTPLRLALQTRDYAQDEAAAALTDYFLARALQQLGYDRAALDEYNKLIARLQQPTLEIRSDRELGQWLARPESVFADVGRLYEKRGQFPQALGAWRAVLRNDADDFEARGHIINVLIAMNHPDEALAQAAEAVRRSGASPQSLEILRDVARKIGKNDVVYDELRRILRERPTDRAVMFALCDLLISSARPADAEAILSDTVRAKWDPEIVSKLFHVYCDEMKSSAAATMLMEASAARADDTPRNIAMFAGLVRPLRRDALRASDVQKLVVPAKTEAAKQYFLATAALVGGRPVLAREAIDRAASVDPIFPPAMWLAVEQTMTRRDLEPAQRDAAVKKLVDRAEKSDHPVLADELRGLVFAAQQQSAEALAAFARAYQSHQITPQGSTSYASLLLQAGDGARYEQVLWREISDHPEFDQPYLDLIEFYLQSGFAPRGSARGTAAAMNVLQRWLNSNPSSVDARIEEAKSVDRDGRPQDAMNAAANLARQYPNDYDVLAKVAQIFFAANSGPQFVALLESLHNTDPTNVTVIDWLTQAYFAIDHKSDLVRVTDALRDASPRDARVMYIVAQFYARAGEKAQSTAALEASWKIDPNDPAVNNDLGFTWADENENLDRAEKMIRLAVNAEPDNGSFLDSMGWILYKQGKFAEARKYLEQAVKFGSNDATVLDHFGDVLYRLGDVAGATVQWRQARELLPPSQTDQVVAMRAAIEMKLKQQQENQPVETAPIGAESTTRPTKQNH